MSVFGYGMIFSMIGALKLEMAGQLKIDNAKVGGLISTLMLSSLFMVLLVGPLVDILGHQILVTAGFLVCFAALAMLVSTKTYAVAAIACSLLGFGGMCINTVGNTLLPLYLFGGNNAPAALNLGNTFFGLGAFISPFIAAMLLKRAGYRITGYLYALLMLIPVVFALTAVYPRLPSAFNFSQAMGLLVNKAVITSGLALFCYVGIEASMAGWVTSYGSALGLSDRTAGLSLSFFWISMIVSRLIAAAVLNPEIGAKAIACSAVLSCILLVLMVKTTSKALAFSLIVLAGFAFGPVFPTIVGIAFAKSPAAFHGSVFGIVKAMGLLGGATIPAAIGIYSRNRTIQQSLIIAIVIAALLFFMALLMDFA